MSKGILNNRDKMIWDNTHKPEITDVVGVVDDEMDDLLDDHDDKVVDIVGDNMNDLLDAHDDKVVSIVGDNMSTLLTGAASTVQLLAGDKSGIGTTAAVKVGTWDATHDIYAKRYSGAVSTITETTSIVLDTIADSKMIQVSGYVVLSNGYIYPISDGSYVNTALQIRIFETASGGITLTAGSALSEATYEFVLYYTLPVTPTP